MLESQWSQFFFKSMNSLWVLVLFFFISGCRPTIPEGSYQGVLSSSSAGRKDVSIRLSYEQTHRGVLEVRDLHQNLLETIRVKWSHQYNHVKVTISSLGSAPVILYPVKTMKGSERDWKCYQGILQYQASLCLGSDRFLLHASNMGFALDIHPKKVAWTLSGTFSAVQEPILFEEPADYKLKEALEKTVLRGFDARIEFQRVLQANEAARIAYFNLLPHLDYKSIFSISSLTPKTIATFVANFVPFVIPTRWLKVKEANELKHAEELTLDILRADLAYQVETLGYIYERDRSNAQYYDQLSQRLESLVKHIDEIGGQDLGKLGVMIDEMSLRSRALDNFFHQEKVRLENSLALDKTALAFSMGLRNPEAVRSLDIEEEESLIENASFIDPGQQEDMIQAAIARSLELKQIDHLIHHAQRVKEEYYFNWADPDVPSQMSLSLIPYLARARAVIQELLMRREQIQAQVTQRAANAILNYNAALESYRILKPELDCLNERLELVSSDVMMGDLPSAIHTSGPNVQWVINTHLQFKLKLNDSLVLFRMARAQIQRVLFESYYSKMINTVKFEGHVGSLVKL